MISAATLVQILVNGATDGMFYVLMALGFTMIFGIMKLVNFAHGEFYMLGGFAVYHLTTALGINYFLALPLAAVCVGLIGAATEQVIFAPLRGRALSMLISALGLQIGLQGLMAIIEGSDAVSLPSPVSGVFRSGLLIFPYERLLVVVIGALLLATFYGFIRFTVLGRAIRATAFDNEAALMQGIPVGRMYTLSFAIGCGLAAIAGGLIAPIFSLTAYMGEPALLKAFVVVILGGLGSVPGALAGGMLLGIGESISATLFGGLTADMLGFALIMIVLLCKPTGLLGHADAA